MGKHRCLFRSGVVALPDFTIPGPGNWIWTSGIINFIVYTCVSPAGTCQTVKEACCATSTTTHEQTQDKSCVFVKSVFPMGALEISSYTGVT